MLNKQQPFGADVITRISATMLDPDALGRLRDLGARDARASSPGRSARRAASTRQVYEVALAGNATMTALALGIDPEPLGRRAVHHVDALVPPSCWPPTSACALHPRARAYVFPALGAYVGGDIVAGSSRPA